MWLARLDEYQYAVGRDYDLFLFGGNRRVLVLTQSFLGVLFDFQQGGAQRRGLCGDFEKIGNMGSAAVWGEGAEYRVRLALYSDAVWHPEHIVHLIHFVALVFVHAMNVGVHCERYRVVTENCQQRFVVHATLQRTSVESVAQGVECKMPGVGILQQTVVVILEGYLFKVVAAFIGDNESLVGVLIPCPPFVLRLLMFPAGKLVCHCADQWNRSARVFHFGCAEYDPGFALIVVCFILGKAVDGAPDMKLRSAEINIFPLHANNSPIRSPVHKSSRINTP